LSMMLRLYDVSRTGYQSWRTRGESARSVRERELLEAVERVYGSVDGLYGSPKVTKALREAGVVVGENRVSRLMRENELVARCARIYRRHAGGQSVLCADKESNLRQTSDRPRSALGR
jgi:putative transposase